MSQSKDIKMSKNVGTLRMLNKYSTSIIAQDVLESTKNIYIWKIWNKIWSIMIPVISLCIKRTEKKYNILANITRFT